MTRTVCPSCAGLGGVLQGSSRDDRTTYGPAQCPTCSGEGSIETDNPCFARLQIDQMRCKTCGVTWDRDDNDVPPCNPTRLGRR